MPRAAKYTDDLPHAKYGVDLAKVPDTYVEPFVAYRVWIWTTEGISSLNSVPWPPKIAFEAKCEYEYASSFPRIKSGHQVPDPECTCGMYAGINMKHLINIGYIQHGIHGEVHLWGRLLRHTLGWRAQYAYPKYFVVPMDMVPLHMTAAQERLDTLVKFGVEIYLQPEKEARVDQKNIPLWMPDYGYSQQGLSYLIEKRKKWYTYGQNVRILAVGDRVTVTAQSDFPHGIGIGVITDIVDGEMYYRMFRPDVIYHKKITDVKWNEKNWRWETTGIGFIRKLFIQKQGR